MSSDTNTAIVRKIVGLQYRESFITSVEEQQLLNTVDSNSWSDALQRRVQHYGYRYDYRQRTIAPSLKIGELPRWSEFLIQRAQKHRLISMKPQQLIVNEYQPGQGIAPHIDSPHYLERPYGPLIWGAIVGSN